MGPMELIERVRRRLAKPGSWTQLSLRRFNPETNVVSHCLRGAMNIEQTGSSENPGSLHLHGFPIEEHLITEMFSVQHRANSIIVQAFKKLFGKRLANGKGNLSITGWNDTSTHTEVLAALDLAIAQGCEEVEVREVEEKELITV